MTNEAGRQMRKYLMKLGKSECYIQVNCKQSVGVNGKVEVKVNLTNECRPPHYNIICDVMREMLTSNSIYNPRS